MLSDKKILDGTGRTYMKITRYLFVSLGVILLACHNEKDPEPSLAGAWAITAVDYKETASVTVEGVTQKAEFTGIGKNFTLTTTFRTNPNTVTNEGSYMLELKTSMMGQPATLEETVDETVWPGTWTLDGTKLTVVSGDDQQNGTILELTGTTLKLKIEMSWSEEPIPGGVLLYEVVRTYTFKRL